MRVLQRLQAVFRLAQVQGYSEQALLVRHLLFEVFQLEPEFIQRGLLPCQEVVSFIDQECDFAFYRRVLRLVRDNAGLLVISQGRFDQPLFNRAAPQHD